MSFNYQNTRRHFGKGGGDSDVDIWLKNPVAKMDALARPGTLYLHTDYNHAVMAYNNYHPSPSIKTLLIPNGQEIRKETYKFWHSQ